MLASPPRIVVLGISGSGKSTLAQSLAAALDVPHVELDALFWGPAWTPVAKEEFCRRANAAARGSSWVIDGNYSVVREIVWPRASCIVWLNYPLWLVFARVWRRTLRRLATGEVLWHGNRETWRRAFCSRESILLWVLTAHGRRRREFSQLQGSGAFPNATWFEFRRPSQARAFLESLGGTDPRAGLSSLAKVSAAANRRR